MCDLFSTFVYDDLYIYISDQELISSYTLVEPQIKQHYYLSAYCTSWPTYIRMLPNKHLKEGHHRPASETLF